MKKRLILVSAVMAVLGIGTAMMYIENTSYEETDELMSNNVEALTQIEPDGGHESPKCGTKEKYYSPDIPCPTCGTKTGMSGVEYSYTKNGNSTTYKDGFWGKEVVCTPAHGMTRDINTVEIKDCE